MSLYISEWLIPLLCFIAMASYQIKFFKKDIKGKRKHETIRGLMTQVRKEWVDNNFGAGGVPINTLRNFNRGSGIFTSAALLALGVLVSDLIHQWKNCFKNNNSSHCDDHDILKIFKYFCVSLAFLLLFFHMAQSIRFSNHLSFCLNILPKDKINQINQSEHKIISPKLFAHVLLKKATWNFAIGMRSLYLSIALGSWLIDEWIFLFVTFIYLYVSIWLDSSTLEYTWEDMMSLDKKLHNNNYDEKNENKDDNNDIEKALEIEK